MTQRPRRRHEPTLVCEAGDAVGFLDAPGVASGALFGAVAEVLDGMAPGAILTVYCDDPTAAATAGGWCTGHCAELLAIIPHEDAGITLTFRRTEARDHSDGVEKSVEQRVQRDPIRTSADPQASGWDLCHRRRTATTMRSLPCPTDSTQIFPAG
jgi:TusA-related sulfurtransferase